MEENKNTQEQNTPTVDEATQKLINDAVATALAEAQKAHKAEEDRRATDAYKKGQEAAKKAAEEEARKAQMNADERAAFEKSQLEAKIAELEATNAELEAKNVLMTNKQKAVSKLTEAEVPVEFADDFLDVDETKTMSKIDDFIKRFNEAVNKGVNKKIPSTTPKQSDTTVPAMSLEQFEKLGITGRMKLSETNPTLWESLQAQLDAKTKKK